MENRFNKFVSWYGDMVDRGSKMVFDIDDFLKFKKYIKNWDMVEKCIEEENEEGESFNWDEIKFVEDVQKDMKRDYYIIEVEGEGCYCLCYDDVDGNRVVVDWELEVRED